MLSPQPLPSLGEITPSSATRQRLYEIAGHWAGLTPDAQALVEPTSGRAVNWRDFDRYTQALALSLAKLGIRRGDRVVTLLPTCADHVLIEFACLRLGAVVIPLGLDLAESKVCQLIGQIQPRALFALGIKGAVDLRPLWQAIRQCCPAIPIQVAVASEEFLEGASNFGGIHYYAWRSAMTCAAIAQPSQAGQIESCDAALAFLTGSCGEDRLTLFSHKDLLVHASHLSPALPDGKSAGRTLVTGPVADLATHTGPLLATLFAGGTAVLLDGAEPKSVFEAQATYGAEFHSSESSPGSSLGLLD